jgi:transcriptional repressor NrdR
MKCLFCEDGTRVIDTREVAGAIRRRRECSACGHRVTTYERVAAANLQIVKSDLRREDFDRDKLLRGLRLACVKRPVPTGTIEAIASDIEAELFRLGKAEIESSVLGEMVMERLRGVDDVAYVRFASVYRRFTDLAVLADEIERLREEKSREEELKRQLSFAL